MPSKASSVSNPCPITIITDEGDKKQDIDRRHHAREHNDNSDGTTS